jgi:vacuolar-type H+-ATPase subunit H
MFVYQLKESKFIITTNNEVDVCKEAILFVSQKSDELKQVIEDGKIEVRYVVDSYTTKAKESIEKCQNDAVKEFNEHSTSLYERVKKLETNIPERMEKLKTDISERFGQIESDVSSVKEVYHFVMSSLKLFISIIFFLIWPLSK